MNITFLIGYYKIGFFAGVTAVIAFATPNVLIMYILSFFAGSINEIVL